MQSGATVIARGIRRSALLSLCSAALVLVGLFSTAQAETSKVQVSVNSGTLHPALELTGASSPVKLEAMPLSLTGTVSSLSQIQVYIDEAFSVTIPLDEGATTFSYDMVVPSGTHVVKLVGISPFADISPTQTLSVIYTPPVADSGGTSSGGSTTPQITGSSAASGSESYGGAIISRDGAATTTYVQPNVSATALPGWLYSGMLTLDIARPGDGDAEIGQMLQRFAVLAGAFSLLIFARPVMYGYYLIRFKWFGLHACRLPRHTWRRPSTHFRILGILLILDVFSFS